MQNITKNTNKSNPVMYKRIFIYLSHEFKVGLVFDNQSVKPICGIIINMYWVFVPPKTLGISGVRRVSFVC